jgi:hypothetical protein
VKLRSIIAAALAALAAACADNNASLKWGPICFPTQDCTFSESCDAQWIGPVEFVAAGTNPLALFVEVANQRPSTENEGQGQLDTATAYVRELVIEDASGAETVVPVAYVVPTSGTAVITLLIPPPAATGNYEVRLRGAWGDETSFETAALVIPVRVCAAAACDFVPSCAAGTGCPYDTGQAPIACGT